MSFTRRVTFAAALLGLALSASASRAQEKSFRETITGAWIVTAVVDEYQNGEKKDNWGGPVKGQITFTGGGHQSVNLFGAILAGEDVNAQDIAQQDTIGGSFSFQYDACALNLIPNSAPPKLLATHEVMY